MLNVANPVQMVCVVSETHIGVEVQDLFTHNPIKMMNIEPNTAGYQVSSATVRALINKAIHACIDVTPVAPKRHKLDAKTPEEIGVQNAMFDYNCFEWREGWSVAANCTERTATQGKAIESVEAALQMRVSTKGARAERGGKKTKAEVAREIIRAGLAASKTPEQMVAEIAETNGFAINLARVYFKENLRKVM